MKYKMTFKKRGELTEKQQKGLLHRLKVKLSKEKDLGAQSVWYLNGQKGIDDAQLSKALRKLKVSHEMSNATIEEA